MTQEQWYAISAVTSSVSALVAALALILSVVNLFSQRSLTKNIDSQNRLLSQRQLLLPLWNHLEAIRDINPSEPVWPDVIIAVNKLELVALCCEGGMVDPAVIRRTLSDRYVELIDRIKQCKADPEKKALKSGEDLLRENRAALSFYEDLKKEMLDRDRLRTQ